jgi:hypothetical protein
LARSPQITPPGVMPGWCAQRPGAATALLPGLGHPGADSIAFVHAQLQHFLVAWKLSEDTTDAIVFLKPRWWAHEDWRDVTVLLAGLLPDPAPLLRALESLVPS